MELLLACIALVCLTVCFVAAMIYFGRTTWNSQRHESEMARLCITALLSQRAETLPVAATLASRPQETTPEDPMGYTSPSDNHRLVRVPALGGLDELYDKAEDIRG